MANTLTPGNGEQWAEFMQQRNYESYVGSKVINKKFEGDFVGNDTVHFTRGGGVTIGDLATSYSTFTPQDIAITDETFVLNLRKYAAISISDEDYVTMRINPDNHFLKEMADGFAKEYDTEIMKQYANAGLAVANTDLGGAGTNITVTAANVYELITVVAQKLDEANAPTDSRWMIISPKEKRAFLNSSLVDRSTSLADTLIEGGLIGTIDGITLYYSNNLQTVSTTKHLLAGQGSPISFAANIRPMVDFVPSSVSGNSFVNIIKAQTKFGVKTFAEDANRLVDITVVA